MKRISIILILLTLITTTLTVVAEVEEDLCTSKPTQCSNTLQRKGVCCKRPHGRGLIYFRNGCQACMYVHMLE